MGRIIGAGRGQTQIWRLRRTGRNLDLVDVGLRAVQEVPLAGSQADLPRSEFFDDDHVAATSHAAETGVGIHRHGHFALLAP